MQSLESLANKYVGQDCTLVVAGKECKAIIGHGDCPRFASVRTYPAGIGFQWHWDSVDRIMTHKAGRFVA
jgi:hypothetical protein